MIPSTHNVLDIAECYLRETSTAGWRSKHPIQTVHDRHIERGRAGKVTMKGENMKNPIKSAKQAWDRFAAGPPPLWRPNLALACLIASLIALALLIWFEV